MSSRYFDRPDQGLARLEEVVLVLYSQEGDGERVDEHIPGTEIEGVVRELEPLVAGARFVLREKIEKGLLLSEPRFDGLAVFLDLLEIAIPLLLRYFAHQPSRQFPYFRSNSVA